ncbi:1,4-alpha-glucan branching protein [Streptomyces sp. NBC_01216]|uniref:maltokinase N-terminal cap-like domain-containing protein n=1 Tax=Streptomyces sp. NBC_01216 TaxID=2903778 RepID=UPI002E11B851|nr:1,4-alpha-glucan branching protein [Streptomyces sp. NBC_01216]
MAVIHHTTMNPGKTALLAGWLPTQPWYAGSGSAPELHRVGGFRLDDPQGEVGIEFMVVTDTSGVRPVTYHVPLGYRGAPLDGGGPALVGTSEHGVLGTRWIYDGAHDPVVAAQLLALLQGRAEPQAQGESGVPDHSVTWALGSGPEGGAFAAAEGTPSVVGQTAEATVLGVPGVPGLVVEVTRVLRAGDRTGEAVRGTVTAGWRAPGGGRSRGPFVVLRSTGA